MLFYAMFSGSVKSDSLLLFGMSLPGSSVQGIFQVRIVEWVVVSFSRVHCMLVFYCSLSVPQFSLLNIFANYKRKIKKKEPTYIFSEK